MAFFCDANLFAIFLTFAVSFARSAHRARRLVSASISAKNLFVQLKSDSTILKIVGSDWLCRCLSSHVPATWLLGTMYLPYLSRYNFEILEKIRLNLKTERTCAISSIRNDIKLVSVYYEETARRGESDVRFNIFACLTFVQFGWKFRNIYH